MNKIKSRQKDYPRDFFILPNITIRRGSTARCLNKCLYVWCYFYTRMNIELLKLLKSA
jgi:hypothetical protein